MPKICQIFKNTYFEEHLQTTGSIIPKAGAHRHSGVQKGVLKNFENIQGNAGAGVSLNKVAGRPEEWKEWGTTSNAI